jgi:hypothetical protein
MCNEVPTTYISIPSQSDNRIAQWQRRIAATRSSKTPLHLWVIGGVTLIWNGFGAFDYLMTQLRVDAYMSSFTAEQLEYFYSYPAWAVAAWATGVWFAFGGSVALLLRSRFAVPIFAISLLGLSSRPSTRTSFPTEWPPWAAASDISSSPSSSGWC